MARICVEIELNTDDGSFTVSKCEPKEEMAEQSGMNMGDGMVAGEADSGRQKYSSMKDALMAAAKLLTEDVGAESEAQAGFDSVQNPQKPGMM